MQLLEMKINAINIEVIFSENEDCYILEIAPRNGGNLISDIIKEASGVDLAKYTIKAALGMDCSDLTEQPIKKFVSSYIIHSLKDGIFDSVQISDELQKDIMRCDLFVKPGEKVYRFENGGFGIGAMLIKHKSIEEMNYRMDNMEKFLKCNVTD